MDGDPFGTAARTAASVLLIGTVGPIATALPVIAPEECSICRHNAAAAEVVNAINSERVSVTSVTVCTMPRR